MLCCFCWRKMMTGLGSRRYSVFMFGILAWICTNSCKNCCSGCLWWKWCWLITPVYIAVKRTDHVWSSSQFFFTLIFLNILLVITTFCAWKTVFFVIIIIPVKKQMGNIKYICLQVPVNDVMCLFYHRRCCRRSENKRRRRERNACYKNCQAYTRYTHQWNLIPSTLNYSIRSSIIKYM